MFRRLPLKLMKWSRTGEIKTYKPIKPKTERGNPNAILPERCDHRYLLPVSSLKSAKQHHQSTETMRIHILVPVPGIT